MHVLLAEPSGGSLKEAFDILEETFGSGGFTPGQAINAMNIALEWNTSKAQNSLNQLISSGCIGDE